jgi:hypothetical protein
VDPDLLVIQPGDSEATAARARRSLVAVTDSASPRPLATYDLAQAAAEGAELRAQAADVKLADARAIATVAAARYRDDRGPARRRHGRGLHDRSTGPFGIAVLSPTPIRTSSPAW